MLQNINVEDSIKNKSNDPELVEGPEIQKWYLYICITQSNHYYVGISSSPKSRLKKHNSGSGAKIAKDQGKLTLVYVSDVYPSKSQARTREVQVKKWSRIKKEKLINPEWV